MLFPACYRPAQVPTMMTSHVDTLTQPNSARVELAWACCPHTWLSVPGMRKLPKIACLHTGPMAGLLDPVLGFYSSVAMARHLDLSPTTPNP